jgi:hypothetical protein
MILSQKEELMQNDFSMCLALLLSFETPEQPSILIVKATEIKKRILSKQALLEEYKTDRSSKSNFNFDQLDKDLRRNAQQSRKGKIYEKVAKPKSKFLGLIPNILTSDIKSKSKPLFGSNANKLKMRNMSANEERDSDNKSPNAPDRAVMRQNSQMEQLQEQYRLQKFQIRNACKNLMQVDEFMMTLQDVKRGDVIDSKRLNESLTDLRDAINMLNSQLKN